MEAYKNQSEEEFWKSVNNRGILEPSPIIWNRFMSKIVCDKNSVNPEWIHFITGIYCNYAQKFTFMAVTSNKNFNEFISFIDGNGYIVTEIESTGKCKTYKVLELNT